MNYHISLLRKKALRFLYIPLGFALLFTALGVLIVNERVTLYTAEATLISSGSQVSDPFMHAEYVDLWVSSIAIARMLDVFESRSVLERTAANIQENGWFVSADELADRGNTITRVALNNFSVGVISENPNYAVAAANAHSDAFVYTLNGIVGWEIIRVLDYSEAATTDTQNNPVLIILAFSLFGLCLGLPLTFIRIFYDNKIAVKEDVLLSTPSEQLILIPRFDIK